ncbi:3-hydroxybutyryl-CoA dehydrogenase [Paenibacillus arenilitoris]|uniref:3-hydroxybutyryl-CoA dehydrogenase n=1 Tax=Paenibacillus arenilitoris TaxID=2772299 RepID=A0A927CQT4_9BACL|nr:3-hydroxybutyryl-CoA dehydrogenase [Paenibacillus arenilitoris]MBD2869950.1 3-hydroxybutyryl-CoA dehydrogenase [Paenibacillus arenilitoris]
MQIRKVTVLGAGQMGSGIAQTFAQHGFEVVLYDIGQEQAARGLGHIRASLVRLANKGRISAEQSQAALDRITLSATLADAADSGLVVEAAPENLEMKKTLFRELDRRCGPDAILATNTSSLPITEIAAATARPEKVIGMHFMNPVPVMPLVEIIGGLRTSDDTLASVKALAQAIGKTAVEVRDYPGFVSNRILMPMINEAVYAVYEGVALPEAVDLVMKLGMNHPMGPLALADFIGLDTCLAIMETLRDGFGDSKYRACPLLRQYVQAGWLGRKTGRGFYDYGDEQRG